jgi:hypothetical protein
MLNQRAECWSQRQFLRGLTLAGTAGVLSLHPRPAAAEPPPETTTLRLSARRRPGPTCQAALYVAKEFLQDGGFSDVQYVEAAGGASLTRHWPSVRSISAWDSPRRSSSTWTRGTR